MLNILCSEYDLINSISSSIGTLGFPILCCYFMWRYINTVMKEFTLTIEENTKILNQILKKLEKRCKDE